MNRVWPIDVLRGIGIILVIIYHAVFDLAFFGIAQINPTTGFWLVFARITASLFILIVGISLSLSYTKRKNQNNAWKRYFLRGLKILGIGFVITAITLILFPEQFILFGILHLIGLGSILAIPALGWKKRNLMLGLISIGIGVILLSFPVNTTWFIWLGLKPVSFMSLDYTPLFPWISLLFFGLFIGNSLQEKLQRYTKKPTLGFGFLAFLGRHTLLIYLIHQPLLIGLLSFFYPITLL